MLHFLNVSEWYPEDSTSSLGVWVSTLKEETNEEIVPRKMSHVSHLDLGEVPRAKHAPRSCNESATNPETQLISDGNSSKVGI
jgi:hypothetical protein